MAKQLVTTSKTVKPFGKRTAEMAFAEHHAAALIALEEIKTALANDMLGHGRKTNEEIHWGHVGSIADIAAQLKQITDGLYNRGEFAPENN